MKLDLNPRENGACPICTYNKGCNLQVRLQVAVQDVAVQDVASTESADNMELVIYTCPKFSEKD